VKERSSQKCLTLTLLESEVMWIWRILQDELGPKDPLVERIYKELKDAEKSR